MRKCSHCGSGVILWKVWVALHLWIVHGIPWRDQYMRFGLRRAYSMAGTIWEFRTYLRENGMRIERDAQM